jgi:hypothetical protein
LIGGDYMHVSTVLLVHSSMEDPYLSGANEIPIHAALGNALTSLHFLKAFLLAYDPSLAFGVLVATHR